MSLSISLHQMPPSKMLVTIPNNIEHHDICSLSDYYQLIIIAENEGYLQSLLSDIYQKHYQTVNLANEHSYHMQALLAMMNLNIDIYPRYDSKMSMLIDAGISSLPILFYQQHQALRLASNMMAQKLPEEIREISLAAQAAILEGFSPEAYDPDASLREALHLFRVTVNHPVGMRDHVAWFNIGWLLWKLDSRLEDAEKALTIAVRQSMGEKDIYFYLAARQLAIVSFLSGKYDNAVQAIHLALRYSNQDPFCLLLQLYLSAAIGDTATISSSLYALLSQHPNWLSHCLAIPNIASYQLELQPVMEQLMGEARSRTANALHDFSELLYEVGEKASSVFKESLLSNDSEAQIKQYKALRGKADIKNDDWLLLQQLYFETQLISDKVTREINKVEEKIPILRTMEWIRIPGGDFLYGEENQKLFLPDYFIMKYPVTVSQYRQFCLITNRPMPRPPDWGWQDSHPMVNISWYDARAFVDWCGLSLPTEEEWEKAARGSAGNRFPWGDEWDASKCCNGVGGAPTQTSPVSAHANGASPFGVVDMTGNVWEWCENWHEENKTRAMRGGSWMNSFTGSFLATSRDHDYPTDWYCYHGFRCITRS